MSSYQSRRAAWAAAEQLATANEYHRRAEMQRRAMMTPEQRAAVDHALEFEQVHDAGRKDAGQKAFTVAAVGIIAAWILGSVVSGLTGMPVLVVLTVLVVLAATAALTVCTYRARMDRLAAELAALEGHDQLT